jgi:hypothetical protein
MRREILFEKCEKPTFVDEDGVQYWENKAGVLHRGYYRPAIIDTEYHTAWFIVNGKVVRVINTHSIEEQIQDIMEEFDFDKVWNTMRFLKWEWRGQGIPNIHQLKEAAAGHLRSAAEYFHNSDERADVLVGSGGLEASYSNYGMRLKFVLEDWDTVIDDEFRKY